MKQYIRAFSVVALGVLTISISNLSFNSFLNNFSSPSFSAQKTFAAAMGPLIHNANERWFRNSVTGKGVYLTGSTNWNVLIGTDEITGSDFDNLPTSWKYGNGYEGYLDFMVEHGHNYLRLRTNPDSNLYYGAPSKYQRSNTCCAVDTGNKWDLNTWNQAYFDEMKDIVKAAEARNIYVGVLFYDGWWIKQSDTSDAAARWSEHPYNPLNNINPQTGGVTMDTIHTLSAPNFVLNRQKDFITKVVNTVDSFDNVIYEISNEDLDGTIAWQEEMAAHTRTITSKPVGITARTSDNNDELWNSTADWTSPDQYTGQDYKNNPPAETYGKVVLSDTDHLWGIGGDEVWVWRTFTRGLNTVFMDPYARQGGNYGNYNDWEKVRFAMGATREYAERVANIASMYPDSSLCGTSYCLVDPGQNYIVYSHQNQNFSLQMQPGSYHYEWYHIIDRTIKGEGDLVVNQAGSQTFDPPTSRVVLFVEKEGVSSTPTATPTNVPSVTATPTGSGGGIPTATPTLTPVPTPFVTPTPITTPTPPPIGGGYNYEAEDANYGDLYRGGASVFAQSHTGYSGSGFVDMSDYPDGRGGFVDWLVTVPSTGSYNLRFRYGLSGLSRGMHLKVNNVSIGDYNFQSVGSWDSWGTLDIPVTLQKGNNAISLIANGSLGGPNMDRLDIVPNGNSIPPTPPAGGGKTRIEAENQNFGDPDGGETVVANDVNGYSGNGFIDMSDYPNGAGAYVDWVVTVPSSGAYPVTFGYGLPSGKRPLNLVVNGVLIEKMTFPSTGGTWADWATYTKDIQLVAGKNVIRTRATNSIGGPNLDYLEY